MVKISNKSILFDLSKSPFLSYHGIDAEKTIGNNSNAAAAHFGAENGYLVYTV
ncbi:MAG: hypothetical protein WA395_15975 [Nitrososphaeraceae archaeon]|jgi:hypothetical protein